MRGWGTIGIVSLAIFAALTLLILSFPTQSQPPGPVKITERTEYGLDHNWVYLEIEDLIGKDQNVNISNIFVEHSLTEQLGYEITLMKQDHSVDDYGWKNVSLGKYKTNVTNTTTFNGTNATNSYYFDNGNLLCKSHYENEIEILDTCDYILGDKSVLKVEWQVYQFSVISQRRPHDQIPQDFE